jgi:hypothetical protein
MPAGLELDSAAQVCTFGPDRFYVIFILGFVDTDWSPCGYATTLLVFCFRENCFTEYLVRASGIIMHMCRLAEPLLRDSVQILKSYGAAVLRSAYRGN